MEAKVSFKRVDFEGDALNLEFRSLIMEETLKDHGLGL